MSQWSIEVIGKHYFSVTVRACGELSRAVTKPVSATVMVTSRKTVDVTAERYGHPNRNQ